MHGPAIRGFLLALGFSVSAAAGPVHVGFTCRDAAPCAVHGNVVLRSVADPSITRSVPIGARGVRLSEAAGTEWEMTVAAKGFWAPSERLTFLEGDEEQPRIVRVWRTGHIRVTVNGRETPPASVRLQVTSPPSPRTAPEIPSGTSFDCAAGKEKSEWSCEVPATTLDLAIRAEGYAPHYIWDTKVTPAGLTNLAEVTLHRGGALLAWLDPSSLQGLQQPVRAVLRRETIPEASVTAMRLAEPVAEAAFSKKGVVHLSPLPAGRYVLEARAEGYVPAQIAVEVHEGRESAVRRLIELFPTVTVRLHIEPPLAPGDVPWQLELFRRTGHGAGSETTARGAASTEGVFEAKNQAEGPVRAVVYDGKRNVLASREITIGPGGGEHTLTLQPLGIAGTVKLGDDPLPRASILFGGTGGAEKVRVTSDDEGKFAVTLPRTGDWPVEVTAPRESVIAAAKVKIAEDTKSIEIALPATEITGWVRDSAGGRLAEANVELFVGGGLQSGVTDATGAFRFRGVGIGTARLRATDPRTREYSQPVQVVLSDTATKVDNVELNIESLRTVKGIVRSGGVPVVGARVHAYGLIGGAAQQERATTDLQGRFAVDMPLSAPTVLLVIGAAGRTLQPFKVVPTTEGVVIDVSPRGGELRLRWPAGTMPIRIVYNDGILLPLADLLDWSHTQGRRPKGGGVEAPELAPGRYQLCSGQICTAGTLVIGSTLDLDLTPLLAGASAASRP